jgi:hypothetical protein
MTCFQSSQKRIKKSSFRSYSEIINKQFKFFFFLLFEFNVKVCRNDNHLTFRTCVRL